VRGKGFPASNLAQRLKTGVGWVPTNTMISCFGPIGDTPFGATGDLILVPDEKTEVRVDFGPECKRRSNNPSLKRPGIPVAPE
jgi:glutamine synthetase